MKREKLSTLSERDLLIGLITSERFCRELCPILNPRLLEIEYARTGNLENNPIHMDMVAAAKQAKLAYIVRDHDINKFIDKKPT